jgi:hypothetical protein
VQVVSRGLLIFFVPSGATGGAIAVTTANGTASSSPKIFNAPLSPGLRIDGIWPNPAHVGDAVFTFGGGFSTAVGGTLVTLNGMRALAVQVVDSGLLLFFVPAGATSGPLCVTVGGDTDCVPIVIEP